MTAARRPDPGGRPAGAGGPASADGRAWGVTDLTVRYGSRLALDHVTVRATAGQVGAVVGGDGAGKSTLLRCLVGVLAVSDGEVARPARRRIGYLSPSSGVYPDLTVLENLAFRASAYGVGPSVAGPRVSQLLERTGLAAARDRLAGQLSGGMRRKLGVIAAMVHQPDLLVLDEPTTGVDPVSRADLWWLIVLAATEGAAVVVSTSYLDEAERTTSVLVLNDGQQLATGTPEEIVAMVPGSLRSTRTRPHGDERRRAWLRAGEWRIWDPPGRNASPAAQDGAVPVQPDLQDAATIAILSRELDTSADLTGASGLATSGG